MGPKVIIFMLRNLNFHLEIEKLSFETNKDSTKDSLSEYNKINLEIDKLIFEKSNLDNKHNIIIETLSSKVQSLESEISNLEKLVVAERTEIDNNKIKQDNLNRISTSRGQKNKKNYQKKYD
jgi:hypothetical protein